MPLPRKKDWRDIQKRRRFRDYYLATGKAIESAKAAGYSPTTANSHAHRMAAAAEETLRDQCDLVGLTKITLIRTLQRALQAREPRWNAKLEKWDYFENVTAQLAAYDRLKEILEPEAPKVKIDAIKIGVAVGKAESEPEAWMERNKVRFEPIQVAVTVQTSAGNGSGNGHSGRNGEL